MRGRSVAKVVLLVSVIIAGSLAAASPQPQAEQQQTRPQAATPGQEARKAPSASEEQFLACAARCGFGAQAEKALACLGSCQEQAKLTGKDVAKFLRFSASGRFGGVGGALGFTCDPFETTCSCSGYWDCKILDKSGCCSKPIDTCGGTPEKCTCEKSPQCGP
jgi:hypothetical protein